jgi:outer membrane biosynthesis protein TonB
LCFAAVVAAHGLGVFWFLPRHDVASEFDAGAPVVMIELPEMVATSATPPSDLAPAPTEAESAPTPPKEEQTKPPEQEAEVALPIPEPPTPAAPTVASPPTAEPSVTMPAVAAQPTPGAEVIPAVVLRRWQSALVAHIERFKRYPAEARAHDERGVARVAFSIDLSASTMRVGSWRATSSRARGQPRSTPSRSRCSTAPSRCRGRRQSWRIRNCRSSSRCASIFGETVSVRRARRFFSLSPLRGRVGEGAWAVPLSMTLLEFGGPHLQRVEVWEIAAFPLSPAKRGREPAAARRDASIRLPLL